MKKIILSEHAKEQCAFRGTNENEVREAIETCPWSPAEHSRLECSKEFAYNTEWNRKVYKTKKVRPIFADKEHEIEVVTVYTYYF